MGGRCPLKNTTKLITALLGLSALGAGAYAIYHHFLPSIPNPTHKVYPFGLLLGCKAHDDGTPTKAQLGRCDLALKQYQEGHYQVLIISGGAVQNEYTEAYFMRDLLKDQGSMPIVCEPTAKNTWENLEKTKEMIGDVPIMIMTGSTHARRAAAMAANFFTDFTVVSYPDFSLKKATQEIPSRIRYCALEIQKRFQQKREQKALEKENRNALQFINEEDDFGDEGYYEFFTGEVEEDENDDEDPTLFDDDWSVYGWD